MKKSPYLSIVIAARNDNYGGDFNQRIQNFISWNTRLLEKYQLTTEIIIVNWNPIDKTPSLQETLNWAENRNFVSYRIITVPNEIHQQYVNTKIRKTVPLFEFIAKNVGIKRAKGQFVLGTNADILFSEELIKELAKNNLSKYTLYRSTRIDFNISKQQIELSEEQILSNATAIFFKGGTVNINFIKNFKLKKTISSIYNQVRILYLNILNKIPFVNLFTDGELEILKYHCNASGDFALQCKESWSKINAYSEDSLISTHVDSIHLFKNVSKNILIFEFPFFVFHQEHARRFNFDEKNTDMDMMFNKLLYFISDYILNKNTLKEDENWGLSNKKLKENTIE
jgi:hypothetical protein